MVSFPPAWLGRELFGDVRRRLRWYISDWVDGVVGPRTKINLLSTVVFIYFLCLLPVVAFGTLLESNTNGFFSVKKNILSQGISGIIFSLLSGQPLVVLLSTAPLALVTHVVFEIAQDYNIPFDAMYAWVGIFNSLLLLIAVLTNLCHAFFKYTSLFVEETFAIFISIAFSYDAIRELIHEFNADYHTPTRQGAPLLWLLLMCGVVFLGTWLWGFRKSVLLSTHARQLVVDFAMPLAVLTMAFFGEYIFRDVPLSTFNFNAPVSLSIPDLNIEGKGIALAFALGLSLSILFFMDQNISSALVQTPSNGLKKGIYYHLDLFVVALVNLLFSLYGLPWVHAALPHSAMHARALADTELHVDPRTGHVFTHVLHVREARVSHLISHALILLSIFLLPVPLKFLPVPVLYGLFLYMAVTALNGNGFWARILLLFTEKSNYPSSTLVKHVPTRVIRKFTLLQLTALAVIAVIGFYPNAYVQMTFPVTLVLLMVVRRLVLPRFFGDALSYLDSNDTYHPEVGEGGEGVGGVDGGGGGEHVVGGLEMNGVGGGLSAGSLQPLAHAEQGETDYVWV
jgi:solute carrier family 4 (sodium borate transporter), member 11